MIRQMRTAVFMAAFMVAASVSAVVLRPTEQLADLGPKVDLEAMVPKQFGDWRIDDTIIPLMPSPDVQASLDKIYNQTLARTYVNDRRERVMLSIAYGSAQTKSLQVHLPEVCYAAQGFHVGSAKKDFTETMAGRVPVMHLVATHGRRREPITYWITVGEQTVRGGFEQKLASIRYGIAGVIPDGMLVRVSSISSDDEQAFELQGRFIRQLLSELSPEDRARLVGKGVLASPAST